MVLALAVPFVLSACGARPPTVVYVDTDAYVPQLFDRLRLELLDENGVRACSSCLHEHLLTATSPTWPVSFGVAPPPDGGTYFVRAQLYRSGHLSAGIPLLTTAIDRIVRLRFDRTHSAQTVYLPMSCASLPSDFAHGLSCNREGSPALAPFEDATAGVPTRSSLNTWRSDLAGRACTGSPRAESSPGLHDDEVCVPGGIFWRGDVRLQERDALVNAVPEQLAVVSPFYLDRFEYTAGRYRAARASGFAPPSGTVVTHTSCVPLDGVQARCVYGSPPGCGAAGSWCCALPATLGDSTHDSEPLNCVSRIVAQQLCAREGRRLPTEAEWEWAAGGREHEWLFPWGDADPGCGDTATPDAPPRWEPTRTCTGRFNLAASPVGSYPHDQSPDGVFDLEGSLQEWVADVFEQYGVGCWAGSAMWFDPRCDLGAGGTSVRGGHFAVPSAIFPVPMRSLRNDALPSAIVGFRCARSAGSVP